MAIIIATIALLLCWTWIEITLFFINKDSNQLAKTRGISYKQFVWILRILIFALFFGLIIYMYFFENIKFQKAIEYCLGIIK